MPHFFFDAHDGSSYDRDEDGHVVASLETARELAVECLPYIAGNKLVKGCDGHDLAVDVRDETGQVVYTACLSLRTQQSE